MTSQDSKKVKLLPGYSSSPISNRVISDQFNQLNAEDLLRFYHNEESIGISLAGHTFKIPCTYALSPQQNGAIQVPNILFELLNNPFELSGEIKVYTSPVKALAAKDNRLFDGEVIRIADLTIRPNETRVILQRASYFDALATNFSIDHLPQGRNESLREYLHNANGKVGDFINNRLVNHIGVVCMVESSDGKLIGQLRSEQVASRGGTLSSSASGGLTLKDLELSFSTHSLIDATIKGIGKEIYEELGFKPDVSKIEFLGALRDLERGGKPDFYFYLRSNHTFSEIESYYQEKAKEKHESIRLLGFDFHSDVLDGSDEEKLHFQKRVNDFLLKTPNQNLTFYAGTLLTAEILTED